MRGNVDLWSEAGDFQHAGSALHPIVQRADRGTIGFGNCEMQGIGSTDVDILATGDFGGAMEIERWDFHDVWKALDICCKQILCILPLHKWHLCGSSFERHRWAKFSQSPIADPYIIVSKRRSASSAFRLKTCKQAPTNPDKTSVGFVTHLPNQLGACFLSRRQGIGELP
jgi:hypothetical protein